METINGTIQIRDLQIVNPTYEVTNVIDNIINKTCEIEVLFNTDSIIKYSYTVTGFSYNLTWEDVDIYNYAKTQLDLLKL